MTKLLRKPIVRLALRALVAGAAVLVTAYMNTGSITRAPIVAGVLAFCEIFTPINGLVGYFKQAK